MSTETLQATLAKFLSMDDVFSEDFLSTVIIGDSESLTPDTQGYLYSMGSAIIHTTTLH
jgi:hypothetical protein